MAEVAGMINHLWPGHTIGKHRSGSTLSQVVACCPTARVFCGLTCVLVEISPIFGLIIVQLIDPHKLYSEA